MFFQAWVADSRKPNGVACQRVRQNKVDSAPLLVIGVQRADFFRTRQCVAEAESLSSVPLLFARY